MNIQLPKLWTPLICAGAIMLASCAAVSQRVANLSQSVPLKEHSVRAYQHEFSQLAFMPGGQQIATLGMDGKSVRALKVWNYTNPGKMGAVKTTGIRPLSSAQEMAFNATRKLMAVVWEPDNIAGQVYRTIEVYQLPQRTKLRTMVIHLNKREQAAQQKVAFSPDGNYLLFSAFSVRMWNTRDWKLQATVRDSSASEIFTYAISPDSSRLATINRKSEVAFWNVRNGRALTPQKESFAIVYPQPQPGPITYKDSYLSFSPDGKSLYILINTTQRAENARVGVEEAATVAAYRWDFAKRSTQVFFLENFFFHAVDFDPQGKYVAIAGFGKQTEVSLWDLKTFTRLQTLNQGGSLSWDIEVSPDGKTIAVAEDLGRLLLWERG